jgi:predicted short-subunit dehydrogenase-like oxidoreductase (DUF2520 family)
MKVTIIGTGNVAWVLGQKMKNAGIEIVEIVGRREEAAAELAAYLSSSSSTDVLKISAISDLYIIAVSDSSIESVARSLSLKNKIIVHTAASISKNVLECLSPDNNFGVIYPLQTLSKAKSSLPVIPVLIDGDTQSTIDILIKFSSIWADNVKIANDDERLTLHVAAVFSTNFTNHLYALANQFCRDKNVDFQLLLPLIEETALRLREHEPAEVQTGPAIRNDTKTLQHHLQLLSGHPHLQHIYKLLSDSIINFHN